MCDRVFTRPEKVTQIKLADFDLFGVFFDADERGYYVADDFGGPDCTPWEEHTAREDYSGPLTYRRAVALLDDAFLSGERDPAFYRDARAALRIHATTYGMTL